MEARIRETGLVVSVYFDSEKSSNSGTPIWIGQVDNEWINFNERELEFINYIDWKKVRIDIAMKMLDIAKTNELYQVDYPENDIQ